MSFTISKRPNKYYCMNILVDPISSSTYVLTFYFRLLDNLPQRKTAFINIMSLGAEENHESVIKGFAKIQIS